MASRCSGSSASRSGSSRSSIHSASGTSVVASAAASDSISSAMVSAMSPTDEYDSATSHSGSRDASISQRDSSGGPDESLQPAPGKDVRGPRRIRRRRRCGNSAPSRRP